MNNNKIINFIKKKNKSKLVTLTAYSKNIASIIDKHCDLILVGDSLASVLYNYKSTKKVTLNTMIEHSKSVRMGVKKSLESFKILILSFFFFPLNLKFLADCGSTPTCPITGILFFINVTTIL